MTLRCKAYKQTLSGTIIDVEEVDATSTQEVAPTCQAKGKSKHTATFTKAWAAAQYKLLEDIDMLQHSYETVVEEAVAATCTAAGKTVKKKCVHGCEGHSGGESIAALGHAWSSSTGKCTRCNTSCSHGGASYGTCSICGLYLGSAPSGDDYDYDVHVHSYSSATCTSPATCSCGATSGSALGHNYVEIAREEATCQHIGSIAYECTRCKDVTVDSIPMTAHNKVLGSTSGEGQLNKVVWVCSECGIQL